MPPSDRLGLAAFGLTIDSDRPIAGALPVASVSAPDLQITTLAPEVWEGAPPPVYRWDGHTLTFCAPNVARFACRHDAITIAALPGADPDMVSALLIATALPAVLWLRGDAMLHAAGVVPPSRRAALALTGPSGVGKSALTAQLLDQGGALLADDSVRVRRCDDRVEGSGLPGGYHLINDEGERRFYHVPPQQSLSTAPIAAVMLLSRTSGPPALARLRPVDAVARLVANQHRPAIPATVGQRGQALATMAFIAAHCAVYEWHRPAVALSEIECDMLAREDLW